MLKTRVFSKSLKQYPKKKKIPVTKPARMINACRRRTDGAAYGGAAGAVTR